MPVRLNTAHSLPRAMPLRPTPVRAGRARRWPLQGALALALTLGAVAPAQALFGDDEARKAVLEVRQRVEALQRDLLRQLNEMGRQQADMEQRLARLESAQRLALEQQNQMEQMRQEIARLRGQVEVQLNELNKSRKLQQELSAQIDSRLKQFEPAQVTIDDRQYSVDLNEKRAYDAALEQFRASDFKSAIASFDAFNRSYPASPYRPLALYWQGGAQYANGDFKSAIGTLQELVNRHADSPRTPDAMLLLGNAQFDGGEKTRARETWQRIVSRFPGTPASGSAKERLSATR